MKSIILDNLETLNRIDKSKLDSTYTLAGIIRQTELEGSFDRNLLILKLFFERRVVIISNGYYAIDKQKIKHIMER